MIAVNCLDGWAVRTAEGPAGTFVAFDLDKEAAQMFAASYDLCLAVELLLEIARRWEPDHSSGEDRKSLALARWSVDKARGKA